MLQNITKKMCYSVYFLVTLFAMSKSYSQNNVIKSGIDYINHGRGIWYSSDIESMCVDNVSGVNINCTQNGNLLALATMQKVVGLCSIEINTKKLIKSKLNELALVSSSEPMFAYVELNGYFGNRSLPLKKSSYNSDQESEIVDALTSFVNTRLCSNLKLSNKFTKLSSKEVIKKTADNCSKPVLVSNDYYESYFTYESCFNYKSVTTNYYDTYRVNEGMVDFSDKLKSNSITNNEEVKRYCRHGTFESFDGKRNFNTPVIKESCESFLKEFKDRIMLEKAK